MSEEDVIDRLDTLIALLSLAFYESVQQGINSIRQDPVARAILDSAADDWIRSGTLQANVITQTGSSPRTVQRRLSELSGRQLLATRGGGSATEYRARRI
jgi:hypothetical protein